jgi:hypothetical protein
MNDYYGDSESWDSEETPRKRAKRRVQSRKQSTASDPGPSTIPQTARALTYRRVWALSSKEDE